MFTIYVPLGVYSICMSITDNAGNTARARTLLIADQVNHVEKGDLSSIRVNYEPMTDLGIYWIPSTGDTTVQWATLFMNMYHMDNHYLAEVKDEVSIDLDDDSDAYGKFTEEI